MQQQSDAVFMWHTNIKAIVQNNATDLGQTILPPKTEKKRIDALIGFIASGIQAWRLS